MYLFVFCKSLQVSSPMPPVPTKWSFKQFFNLHFIRKNKVCLVHCTIIFTISTGRKLTKREEAQEATTMTYVPCNTLHIQTLDIGFSLGNCRKKTALKMFPLCLFFLLSFCYQILTRSQHTIPHPSLILLLLVFAKCYSLTTKYCYHSDFRIIQSGFNKHAKISCNMPAKNV